MPYKDPEKQRQAMRKWEQNNREKINASRRKAPKEVRDKRNKTWSKWRSKNKESRMEKEKQARDRFYTKNDPYWYNVKLNYNLTKDQFFEILIKQNSCCGICLEPFTDKNKPVVDHDHSTGIVRGLLHTKCNTGLGKLGDTIEGVKKALDYLEKSYNNKRKEIAPYGEQ